jgi:hypothetical protein
MAHERELSVNRGQEVDLYHRVLGEIFGQTIGQCLCPSGISCESQRQRRDKFYLSARRTCESGRGALPGLLYIAEHGLPQGRVCFEARCRLLFLYSVGSKDGLTGKLPGLPDLPEISGCFGFGRDQDIFGSFANSPVHLSGHSCRIALQKGELVGVEAQVR